MEAFVLVLMLLGIHFSACVALLNVARNKVIGRFYLLSLIGIWAGYFCYEAFLIDCPLTKCNIRPDLIVIIPYLLVGSILNIYGLARHLSEDEVSRARSAAAVSLAQGASPTVENRASDDTTELMSMAAIGNLAGIEKLLHEGADIEGADERGWTSLMYAARRDELGAVDLLLRQGADPSRRNNDQLTAGDIASRHGNHEVAALLDGSRGKGGDV